MTFIALDDDRTRIRENCFEISGSLESGLCSVRYAVTVPPKLSKRTLVGIRDMVTPHNHRNYLTPHCQQCALHTSSSREMVMVELACERVGGDEVEITERIKTTNVTAQFHNLQSYVNTHDAVADSLSLHSMLRYAEVPFDPLAKRNHGKPLKHAGHTRSSVGVYFRYFLEQFFRDNSLSIAYNARQSRSGAYNFSAPLQKMASFVNIHNLLAHLRGEELPYTPEVDQELFEGLGVRWE